MTNRQLVDLENEVVRLRADLATAKRATVAALERAERAEADRWPCPHCDATCPHGTGERAGTKTVNQSWLDEMASRPSVLEAIPHPGAALPPLPDGWEDAATTSHAAWHNGHHLVSVVGDRPALCIRDAARLETVVINVEALDDLILVLRHAQAAQQKLQGGAK